MVRQLLIALGVFSTALLPAGQVQGAAVEKQVLKSLVLPDTPKDTAISGDGKYLFVLTGSKVLVYDGKGVSKGAIEVDGDPDLITATPKGDSIYLTNSATKLMQMVSVDFVQQITTDGNPFKGKAEAPVVIAVFSDFQ